MNLSNRNNLIFMEFEILGKRQKDIAIAHGLAEKTVKLIICRIRKNQMTQPTHKELNEKIKKLYNNGYGKELIQHKLKVTRQHVNTAIGYMVKKERAEIVKPEKTYPYHERDEAMKKFYNTLNTKGALSKVHIQDMGSYNSGYTK